MPLRPADLAPGGIEALGAPFKRDRHRGIQAIKTLKEIGAGRARRREQRVQNDGLSVQAQMAPLCFQLGDGQPPVHAAAGGALPEGPGTIGEFI